MEMHSNCMSANEYWFFIYMKIFVLINVHAKNIVYNNSSTFLLAHKYVFVFFFNLKCLLHMFSAHLNHIRKVAGADHIGLGAGFDGINL